MKILDILQSGKLGTIVTVQTRYGQVRRPYVIPRDPHSEDQLRIRSNFRHGPSHWRKLTDDQRLAWTIAAAHEHSQPSLGQSGTLPGYVLFVKINSNLAYLGLPPVLLPPPRPIFDENPIGQLFVTNTNGVADLKLSVTGAPAQYTLVFATAPCSAGVSFAKHFTFRGLLPAPVANLSTITDLYVPKYGVPPVGSRVFIRTQQHIDGWRDLFKQINAIVQPA